LGIEPGEVFCQKTSIGFVDHVAELFQGLVNGVPLVMVPTHTLQSAGSFASVLNRWQITRITLVPSLLDALLESESLHVPNLRVMYSSGEALRLDNGKVFRERFPGARLVNIYGSTEVGADATAWEVDTSETGVLIGGTSPIGRGIDRQRVYLLGPAGELLPEGAVGEVYVGGAGLARGYLGRPEQTAERFVPDPFDEAEGGGRLYRTGDLARFGRDGCLEYVGRVDHQVNIRGFRVEPAEIEAALSREEAIQQAVVGIEQHRGETRIIAHVRPTQAYMDELAHKLNDDNLEQWTKVWEFHYADANTAEQTDLDFSGWNSSYTGEPMLLDDTKELLAGAMKRILALKPKKLLEVGVGTGLLLYRYAEHCESIYALDPSAAALGGIQQEIDRRGWRHISLSQGDALSIEALAGSDYDTIVINSVVQYFPNRLYFEALLARALDCIQSCGKIFIGDLRNYDLLEAHAAAIERSRLGQRIAVSEFRQRVQQRLRQEKELLVSPSFFLSLAADTASIVDVDIQLRRGVGDNEMMRYRYDVVLSVDKQNAASRPVNSIAADLAEQKAALKWFDYSGVEVLRGVLSAGEYETFAVSGLSNPRVREDVAIAEGVKHWPGNQLVSLSERAGHLNQESIEQMHAFEALLQFAEQCGYQPAVTWSQERLDCLDVVFSRLRAPSALARHAYKRRPFANNPQLQTIGHQLFSLLKPSLTERLPDYMVPAYLVAVEQFPLLPNGKVDTRSLPGRQESDLEQMEHQAPKSEVEKILCELWCDTLKLDTVGVCHDFFTLGGHSVLATKLLARIREVFAVELPIRQLFDATTVREQAMAIEKARSDNAAWSLDAPAQVSRAQPLPASYAQQRLWYASQVTGGLPVYNIPLALRIDGRLDVEALIESLVGIHQRHESLRTRFEQRDGQLVQVIDDTKLFVRLEQVASEEVLKPIYFEERHQTFEMDGGVLFRVRLLRVDREDYHALLITMHHSIADGWSLRIFFRELSALYQTNRDGQASPLEPLSIQYADYAVWQRKWLSEGVLDRQTAYWRQQLKDLPPLLNLPTDRPRASEQSFRGSLQTFDLPVELVDKLKNLSRAHNATLYMTLLTAFGILLGRYSGQDDFALGTPVANRLRKETEGLIGFFINLLVIRCQIDRRQSFTDLLARQREVSLQGFAHQDVPFDYLVETLNPERSASYSPLFQVVFALQSAATKSTAVSEFNLNPLSFEAHGSTVTNEGTLEGIARFDLTLSLSESAQGISGWAEFNTDLFDRCTIVQMLGHYRQLLESIADNPSACVSQLQMLNQQERLRQLHDWGLRKAPMPESSGIHHLVEQQVVQRPDSIALVLVEGCDCAVHLTYAELNRRANRLAHILVAMNISCENRVGVLTSRSLDTFVGILATLKAGACYVPLDPKLPTGRLRQLLHPSSIDLLLSQRALTGELAIGEILKAEAGAEQGIVPLVLLDDLKPVASTGPTSENPHVVVHPRSLAYTIYTSGSSGEPKGVGLSHHSLCNLAVYQARQYGLGPHSRVLQFASIGFDAATWDWSMSLTRGAALHIITEEMVTCADRLGHAVEAHSITYSFIPPALLSSLAIEQFDSVGTLTVGGESPSREVLQPWLVGRRVFNAYGPTESTVVATTCEIQPDMDPPPIGGPIDNVCVYVLDPDKQLLPTGAVGELHIGGGGLARGYPERPGLTGEKFIPDSFSGCPGARLYCTGDLVRYRQDGKLMFVGRADEQVSLRGFRVELGEIEAVLRRLRGVVDAVANVVEAEQKRVIIAYFIPEGEEADGLSLACEPTESLSDQLGKYLRNQLPVYMVPAAVVELPAFPLMASGKVDKKRLPLPKLSVRSNYSPAMTTQQRILCGLWQQILGLESVGIDDDFFSLGGDSILGIRVVSQAKAHSLHFDVNLLFKYKTVRVICEHLSEVRLHADQGDSSGKLSPLPIQRWFWSHKTDWYHHFHQSHSFLIDEKISAQTLAACIAALHRKHDALRLRFHPAEGGSAHDVEPVFSPFEDKLLHTCVHEYALNSDDYADVLEHIRVEGGRVKAAVDLRRGPLLKALIFRTGGDKSYLLLICHHLVIDGVSWRIIVHDLEQALGQCHRDQPITLGPKTTAYQRWAEHIEHYAGSHLPAATRDFWLEQWEGAANTLPLDSQAISADADHTFADVDICRAHLSKRETQALLTSANQAYGTQAQELLLAGLALAIQRWTSHSHFTILLESHGRESEAFDGMDLSDTLGWFTCLFPFLLDLRAPAGETEDNALAAAIITLKDQWRAVPRRGLDYGILRYLCKDDDIVAREKQYRPQLMFNYFGQVSADSRGATALTPHPVASGPDIADGFPRSHLVEINAEVRDGHLGFQVEYSRRHFKSTVMATFGQHLQDALRQLLSHCDRRQEVTLTPGDFPSTALSRSEIRDLQHRFWPLVDIYPATSMQAGLMFHTLRDSRREAYLTQLWFEIEGAFDPECLANAWQAVIERHDIFRTAFVEAAGQLLQVVQGRANLPWEHLDWSDIPADQVAKRFEILRQRDKQVGIDFDVAPLLRMTCVRLSPIRHLWLWTHHHSILDGWSMPLILQEVFSTYRDSLADRSVSKAPPPAFKHYVHWLRRQDRLGAIQFWARELNGVMPCGGLPLNESAYEGRPQSRERCIKTLDPGLSEELSALARSSGVTVNTLFQAAWACVLSLGCARDDVIFGQTVSGRQADVAGIDSMVGLFINTLPVPVVIKGELTLKAWLDDIQRAQSQREAHGFLPLNDIHGSGQRLFHSLLVFENYPASSDLTQDLPFNLSKVNSDESTDYAVTLMIQPLKSFKLTLLHASEVISSAAADILLERLAAVLEVFTVSPEARLGTLVEGLATQYPAYTKPESAAAFDAESRLGDGQERPLRIWQSPRGSLMAMQEVIDRVPGVIKSAVVKLPSGALVCCLLPAKGETQVEISTRILGYLRSGSKPEVLPNIIHCVPSLPLNAGDYIDIDALPNPEQGRRGALANVPFKAPVNGTQELLCDIWQKILGREKVGVNDNYFALGGDSIRSLGIVSEAKKHGVYFSVNDLFSHPSIERLAETAVRHQAHGLDAEAIAPFALIDAAERLRLAASIADEQLLDAFPLTMMQHGMVVLAQRQSALNTYENLQLYQFNHPWDATAFEHALVWLLDKHPMMKAVYDLSGERPLQLIRRVYRPGLRVVDLSQDSEEVAHKAIREWMQEEKSRGIDTQMALWRAAVYLLPGGRFVFGLFLNHALWDGWSLESFIAELYQSYDRLLRGQPLPGAEVIPSFNQYVALELAALEDDKERNFWQQETAGMAELPWWSGRTKSSSVMIRCDYSRDLSRRLAALGGELGVADKSLWSAIYLALLSLLNGTHKVAACVMTQARPEMSGADKMVGLFLNALPLQVSTRQASWRQYICAVDRCLNRQHQHRFLPIAEIQKLSGLDFSAAVLNYTNWHMYTQDQAREGIDAPKKIDAWAETDYLFLMDAYKDDRSQCFCADLSVDAAVFDEHSRRRIKVYLDNLVRQLVERPDEVIDSSALLTRQERQDLLFTWNHNAATVPAVGLAQLFEAQVTRTPDAVALVAGDRQLSYAALN
ncbi:amino acid adenylation domain-containing protein, partial [Microbulbifer sp. TYP-18]|uniref:amino acid adenylation domain-containing protein n=1 Tax=Microbulbifer sp. TYP-18 TaxID=3230024 RepID=UPI0034C64FDF